MVEFYVMRSSNNGFLEAGYSQGYVDPRRFEDVIYTSGQIDPRFSRVNYDYAYQNYPDVYPQFGGWYGNDLPLRRSLGPGLDFQVHVGYGNRSGDGRYIGGSGGVIIGNQNYLGSYRDGIDPRFGYDPRFGGTDPRLQYDPRLDFDPRFGPRVGYRSQPGYNQRYMSQFDGYNGYNGYNDFYQYSRHPEFQAQSPRIGYGNSNFHWQMDQYRQRYYEQFRERQMMAMERSRMRRNRHSQPSPEQVPEDVSNQPTNAPPRDFDGELPATPEGYVPEKWNNLDHRTAKYSVARGVGADLLPILRQIPEKQQRQQVAEQYLRAHRGLIERDGLSVLGFKGEQILVRNAAGQVYIADAVESIGNLNGMKPGWAIIDDPSKINPSEFRN